MLVACVLRSGGDFSVEYVRRLGDAVERHLSIGHEFVCLSDVPVPCERIPLETDWPGWWAKIELFRLRGKVLYFDLDTVIKGPIDDLAAYPHKFTMLNDVGRYTRPASGIMAWDGDYTRIYEGFSAELIPKYQDGALGSKGGPWGDGGYISDVLGHENIEIFQDLFPGQIMSYKWQSPDERRTCNVVCYHGPPRPHETGWAA